MLKDNAIWMAQGDESCNLLLNQANRHGLIAGASGTGKTVTLKVMAEGFSQAGVPVFMADVKGDVTGMAQPGEDNENMQKRITKFGIQNWSYEGCPCRFWDMIDGTGGLPVRVSVSQMGPVILSRLLGLSDVQEGVLNIIFRIADDKKMLLIDLKDLRAMLNYVAQRSDQFQTTYGNVNAQSVGAILRALIAVEDQGGNEFFGEPSLDLDDWFACDEHGRGYVNILNAVKLVKSPQIYAMFLLWMMNELFETLPEVGDPEKPKFVFFFDEAHLLFDGMPKELLDKIIQVVKLVRSKGVGVYFITQSPNDIPDAVLAQLSNRVQHGLRAYTPAEQKVVKAAASSFRPNPKFKAEDVITDLGTGEALVSFLDEEGRPSIVERAKVLPPQCLMAAASDDIIKGVISKQSDLMAKYGTAVDRESAYENIESINDAAQQRLGDGDDEGDAAADAPAAEQETPTATRDVDADAARAAATAQAAAQAALEAAQAVENAAPEDMEAAAAKAQEAADVAKRAAAVASAVAAAKAASDAAGMTGATDAAPKKAAKSSKASADDDLDLTDKQKKELAAKKAKEKAAAEKAAAAAAKEAEKQAKAEAAAQQKAAAAALKEEERKERARAKQQEQIMKEVTKVATSAINSFGRSAGKDLVRGLLGSLVKK